MKKDLKTRTLPNGKEYCAELADTERKQDSCTGDLEDGFYLSNRDKERASKTLDSGIERINRATRKCPWYKPNCNK